jgi:hydrogenase 3 maturation protease
MANKVDEELRDWFAGAKKVVIAGVGNPIRTDDYVGLKIVENLKGKLPETILLLEAETVPESYLSDIEAFCPSHVLLIDSAFLGLNPGEACLVGAEKIASYSAVSTHLLPMRIFCDFIKLATEAKIALLLIEPKSMAFGESLTPEVEAEANRLVFLLLGLLG